MLKMRRRQVSREEPIGNESEVGEWENFLATSSRYGVAGINTELYIAHLRKWQSKLFFETSKDTAVIIIYTEVPPSDSRSTALRKLVICEELLLQQHFQADPQPSSRFISICSRNSISPFGITEDSFRQLLAHNKVNPKFLDVVFAFGGKARNFAAGSGSMIISEYGKGIYETQYILSYPEGFPGVQVRSWTIRQIGIYHRHETSCNVNFWILLHARPKSVAQACLEAAVKDCVDPRHIHSAILSSYLDNWRWYLETLNESLEKIIDIALTLDFSIAEHYRKGSDVLLNLQYLVDLVLPLSSRLGATLATLSTLKDMNESIFVEDPKHGRQQQAVFRRQLEYYVTCLQGHNRGVDLMERRSREILNMLGIALNLRNQSSALGISGNLLNLTGETANDGATVRVVTIVTMLYLPASFVAVSDINPIISPMLMTFSSLLGSNLFAFESTDGSSGFQISRQFWIYIAISLPLTILTIGSWFFYTRSKRLSIMKRTLPKV